jgi:hypothetical protein
MFAISAADAVSPAIQRTRTFLFRPFRLGTYLKLCLVAVITEGFGGSFQFSSPVGHSSHHKLNLYTSSTLTSGWIAMLVAASVVMIVLSFVLFYLITRLRFAYFHCLIHDTKKIRPGWHLYRAQATRFFWVNVGVGFCFLLVAALVMLPFAAGFWRLFRNVPAGGHPDFAIILALLLPAIPVILLLVLLAIAADLVLRDLMLPHFALENATAGEAWSAVWTRIKAEKGSFFAYALLRVVLPIVAMVGLFVLLILPGILFIAVIAAVEVGLHAAFSYATSAVAMMGIVLKVLVGVVAFGTVMLAGIGFGGPLSTAIREYALLFYGGRYQPLGDILSPPPNAGLNAPGVV